MVTIQANMASPAADSKEKTRRHWRVLRAALLSRRQESDAATASRISTDFFALFPASSAAEGVANGRGMMRIRQPAADNFEWMAYDMALPSLEEENAVLQGRDGARRTVLVHEKSKAASKKVPVAELLSHQVNQGVDNTGNIRTWPSEQILLWHVLRSGVGRQISRDATHPAGGNASINCCELGSGMAGLASLGLLAHSPFAIGEMLITDGNPKSVDNLKLTVEENRRQGALPATTKVSAELLRWDRIAQLPEQWRHRFHLVLASDCLFFEEFHEDLAHTIKQLLDPRSGRCLLLQPSRNGSMERFCVKARALGLDLQICDDYDVEITRRHVEYQQTRADYVPDVHYPKLVTASRSR